MPPNNSPSSLSSKNGENIIELPKGLLIPTDDQLKAHFQEFFNAADYLEQIDEVLKEIKQKIEKKVKENQIFQAEFSDEDKASLSRLIDECIDRISVLQAEDFEFKWNDLSPHEDSGSHHRHHIQFRIENQEDLLQKIAQPAEQFDFLLQFISVIQQISRRLNKYKDEIAQAKKRIEELEESISEAQERLEECKSEEKDQSKKQAFEIKAMKSSLSGQKRKLEGNKARIAKREKSIPVQTDNLQTVLNKLKASITDSERDSIDKLAQDPELTELFSQYELEPAKTEEKIRQIFCRKQKAEFITHNPELRKINLSGDNLKWVRRAILGLILLGAGGYAVEEICMDSNAGTATEEKIKIIDSLFIEGIRFNIDASWEEAFDKGEMSMEQLKELLQSNLKKLKKYMDIPEGIVLALKNKKGEFGLSLMMEHDMYKAEEDNEFELKKIIPLDILKMGPKVFKTSSLLHELVLLVRSAHLVAHLGFEEGLAEYIEMQEYPRKAEEHSMLYAFLNKFPELEHIPIEDPVLGFRDFKKRGESELIGLIALKQEMRRRAWKRFMKNTNCEDFLRKLQQAQKENPKDLWRIEDILSLGDNLDPNFSSWFLNEGVFKPAKEQKIARAVYQNGSIHILTFNIKKIKKDHPNDPDLFEIKPSDENMYVTLWLTEEIQKIQGFETMTLTVTASPEGILQMMPLTDMPEHLKKLSEYADHIRIKFASGEEIPLKIIE